MFVKEINAGFKKKNSYYKVEIDAYNNFNIQTFSNAFIVTKNDSSDKITLIGYNDDKHKKKNWLGNEMDLLWVLLVKLYKLPLLCL
ncbi:unnamed protein product [Ambrosiozyma monospora]|uniref:Unnamed protein product n=1 Tax=Ambrosiozyma monospora TaxID=43982 RepID=A0ACB5T0U0_AMBMO|nr:unnamed protein product [Ambrosiozyma monospora]